jgi:hypothetical protein
MLNPFPITESLVAHQGGILPRPPNLYNDGWRATCLITEGVPSVPGRLTHKRATPIVAVSAFVYLASFPLLLAMRTLQISSLTPVASVAYGLASVLALSVVSSYPLASSTAGVR